MNTPKIILFGGYGVFGSYIARDLLQHADCQVVIAGRNRVRAEALCKKLGPRTLPEVCETRQQ